jgi:hypothetical protein
MVYHIENVGFLRDLMKFAPEIAKDIIEDCIRDSGLDIRHPEAVMREIVVPCRETTTDEGLEACIVMSREDISRELVGRPEVSKKFENALKEIDRNLGSIKQTWYEEHRL